MAAWIAFGVDGDPVGVGGFGVVVGGVGVGADEDGHVLFATAGDELAEDVTVVKPGAAMVKGDVGGVVGDAASAAETDSVAAGALEVVEPEVEIEVCGVVFDQGELGPALRLRGPGRDGFYGRGTLSPEVSWGKSEGRSCGCGGLQKFTAREGLGIHARNGTR